MLYFTRFAICNHIPPEEAIMKDFGSNTTGTGVFLHALNWNFDIRDTNPTLVCINPNLLPEMKINACLERTPQLYSHCISFTTVIRA
jgi:hypothetical protein